MKNLILAFAFSVGLISTNTAQPQIKNGPAIAVDKEVHDFGTIAFDGSGTCEFKVTNTGTEPLILKKCKASCGCTVPTCDFNPILPGESSVMTVKYNTHRSGPIDKSVMIISNAKNQPSKVVRIKGTVSPDPNAPAPGGAPAKDPSGPANN